jgi:hypothetical protein
VEQGRHLLNWKRNSCCKLPEKCLTAIGKVVSPSEDAVVLLPPGDDDIIHPVHLIQAAGAAAEAVAVTGLQGEGAKPDVGEHIAAVVFHGHAFGGIEDDLDRAGRSVAVGIDRGIEDEVAVDADSDAALNFEAAAGAEGIENDGQVARAINEFGTVFAPREVGQLADGKAGPIGWIGNRARARK